MSAPKYEDLDAETEPGYLEPEKIGRTETDSPSRGRLWIRLAIPFGLACLLFTIIVLPVYFDNVFLRITVLVVLVIGLVLCVAGILNSKQCRKKRQVCDMGQLGNGKLSEPERY